MLKLAALITLLTVASPVLAQTVPGPPLAVTSSVTGTTVTLTWSPPATGGVPSGYVVEASVAPGGVPVATLPVIDPVLQVTRVPIGVYYVRVRAVNFAGQSTPSPELTVTVSSTGCPGPPAPPANVRLRAVGLAATVSWTAPTTGCPATSYIVFAGSAPGTSDVARIDAGAELGLNAVAAPGTYFVRVASVNQHGTSAASADYRAVIAVNNFTDTLPPFQAVSFDVAAIGAGNYLGALSWTDPTVDLDMYLASAGCPYPPGVCLLSASQNKTGSTEQVVRAVGAGDVYRLWVENLSNRTVSFTIENFVSGVPNPVGPQPGAVSVPDGGRQ